MNKFYVSTPIYYPSANVHLGHCYSTIIADCIARYKRLRGFDVMFVTGTDEHGKKIELCAQKKNMNPKDYVDEISLNFRKLWKILNISYDKFIRTTDDYHVKSVKKIFKNLYDKELIYKGRYEGWYCVSCEAFFTDSQINDGKCPDCNREVKWQEEEAYFFKLSQYQDKIIELLQNEEFIKPECRRNEMINFVKSGLQDLCVSRSSFDWGIKVDFDPKHVVYVWLDALTNYINAVGYLDDNESFEKYWPADIHIMGKEIVRFHAVIWPAILMALDLPLPRQIFAHGWILFDNDKMSKSKGNIVDPFLLCDRYGPDSLRYFLLREFPIGNDGSFSYESFISRLNSDLSNDLGNLLSRSASLIEKYFDSQLILDQEHSDIDDKLIDSCKSLCSKVEKHFDNLEFSLALGKIWEFVGECNKYIDSCAPWNLSNDVSNRPRLSTILYNIMESLRVISILISPVIPETSKKIQNQIGVDESICNWNDSKIWGKLTKNVKIQKKDILFPRLDLNEEIKKLTSTEILPDVKINIEDFTKVEMKVAKVISCEKVKKSKKLLKFLVHDGTNERIIVSGISKYYLPEELIGHNVIIVSNLKTATLCGIESNGMIIAASDGNNVKVILADDMPPGSKIS